MGFLSKEITCPLCGNNAKVWTGYTVDEDNYWSKNREKLETRTKCESCGYNYFLPRFDLYINLLLVLMIAIPMIFFVVIIAFTLIYAFLIFFIYFVTGLFVIIEFLPIIVVISYYQTTKFKGYIVKEIIEHSKNVVAGELNYSITSDDYVTDWKKIKILLERYNQKQL